MKVYVSLFGKKENILGWLDLFEQEKLSYKFKGENIQKFSSVNILVGFNIHKKLIKKLISEEEEKFFIIESLAFSKKEKKRTVVKILGLLIKRKNFLIIPENISLLLIKNLYNRREILELLRNVLVKAFKQIKLPYVHLWYYPQSCKTIFLFRQDIDYIGKKDIESLLNITSKYNIKGTYFINISGEEEFDEKIGHLKLLKPTTPERKEILFKLINQGNEIANHGYWHWVFNDFKNNYENIKKCSWYLYNLFRLKTKGFASPGAECNKSLAKAIEQNKLLYSSNGLSDGGLPYYPYFNSLKIKTLEIPFYFLCDASFEKNSSQESLNILKDYYLSLINKNIHNSEPIAILGHPHIIGKYAKSLYLPIFKRINKVGVCNFTIEEFVHWWKRREKVKIFCQRSNNKLVIESSQPNVLLEVIYKRNRTILKTDQENKIDFNL